MGLLRLFLAIAVFFFHAGLSNSFGLSVMGGGAAVFCFFVVSGFYVEMVLSEKYNKLRLGSDWIKLFWLARFWRLYPTYIVVVVAVVVFIVLSPFTVLPKTLQISNTLSLFENFRSIVTWIFNISMFFLNLPSTSDLLIGPGWSLGIEVSFYAVAPFVLRSRPLLLVIFSLVGLGLQLIPYGQHSPILFGFHFFLLGALARRYTMQIQSIIYRFGRPSLLWMYVITFVVIFFAIPGDIYVGVANAHSHNGLDRFIYPLFMVILIPWLHECTKNNKIDMLVGNLSYPFYLLHEFVIKAFYPWSSELKMPFLLLICLVFSLIIVLLESRFVEPWRSRIAHRKNKIIYTNYA